MPEDQLGPKVYRLQKRNRYLSIQPESAEDAQLAQLYSHPPLFTVRHRCVRTFENHAALTSLQLDDASYVARKAPRQHMTTSVHVGAATSRVWRAKVCVPRAAKLVFVSTYALPLDGRRVAINQLLAARENKAAVQQLQIPTELHPSGSVCCVPQFRCVPGTRCF